MRSQLFPMLFEIVICRLDSANPFFRSCRYGAGKNAVLCLRTFQAKPPFRERPFWRARLMNGVTNDCRSRYLRLALVYAGARSAFSESAARHGFTSSIGRTYIVAALGFANKAVILAKTDKDKAAAKAVRKMARKLAWLAEN